MVTINEALEVDEYKTVNVTGKIMNKKDQIQLVFKNSKQLRKVDCLIADQTASIKVTLREDAIDAVSSGKTYIFTEFKVRVFDDVKFLNTNPSTTIVETDDMFKDKNLVPDELNHTIAEGRCVGFILKIAIYHALYATILYMMKIPRTTKSPVLHAQPLCYHQNALPNMCVP